LLQIYPNITRHISCRNIRAYVWSNNDKTDSAWIRTLHINTEWAGQVVGNSLTVENVWRAFITGPNGEGMMDPNSLVDMPSG
jgi:hypothetical protein